MGQTSLVYKGIKFDSDEEVFFSMWLEEMKQAGIIAIWEKPIIPIKILDALKVDYLKTTKLKTKVKEEVKQLTLLTDFEYTPDFFISFYHREPVFKYVSLIGGLNDTNPNALFFTPSFHVKLTVEVKPIFDMQNMTRDFKVKRKIIWDKKRIFVNLIDDIEAFFKKTFMPVEAAEYFKYKKSPTGKNKGKKFVGDWKMDWNPRTIKEYLEL